jgi:pilus assembly protein Flp/PilA
MERLAISFARSESGATAVEYALMVAFIALAVIVAVTALGVNVDGLFRNAGLNSVLSGS